MASSIAYLVGVWRGEGHGEYPTMESFAYVEEVRFLDLGASALVYQQHARSPDGDLLHLETGVWRPLDDDRIAVSIALPRVTEISEGTVTADGISLRATSVRRAISGGAGLIAVAREYKLDGDTLRYQIGMATESVAGVTNHLVGSLTRVRGADVEAVSPG